MYPAQPGAAGERPSRVWRAGAGTLLPHGVHPPLPGGHPADGAVHQRKDRQASRNRYNVVQYNTMQYNM